LLGMYPLYGSVLTPNTNLLGTKVEDGDADGIDDPRMNATRHNLTSSHASVSHQENGSLPRNATGRVVTETVETTVDHPTVVVAIDGVVARNQASSG
jgi:hypothetical protein